MKGDVGTANGLPNIAVISPISKRDLNDGALPIHINTGFAKSSRKIEGSFAMRHHVQVEEVVA